MIEFNFKKEKSCGFVVYQRPEEGEIKYLLVRQGNNTWGFPKGHIENNESELQTAMRELKEETGLEVRIFLGFKEVISYTLGKNAVKKVIFFLGESDTDEVKCDGAEIVEYRWLPYNIALSQLSFDDLKRVLEKANVCLNTIKRKSGEI